MITDEERREVAERLRMCARETNGARDFAMYLSYWVGVDGPTLDEGNPFTVAADRRLAERTLEKLADLINPTCFDTESKDSKSFTCSACGFSESKLVVNPFTLTFHGSSLVIAIAPNAARWWSRRRKMSDAGLPNASPEQKAKEQQETKEQ